MKWFIILQSPVCRTLQTVLLMRTWFIFHHIVMAVVMGAQHHRVLQMKSVIRIYFLYLLILEFYSDIIAFTSIGQISMAVKEFSSFVTEV